MRRILTIDGGGIRGVFPAAFLASLEADLPHPIGRYFDLIAGTSTGGIIAIGLALGFKASEILELYESKGPEIFAQAGPRLLGWFSRPVRTAKWYLWGPKYSPAALKAALIGILGDRRLGDAKTRLMVPSWHTQTQHVYLFKTAHHPRFLKDRKVLAVDVAMATAAAPTYFEEHMTANDVGLVDGGIWANNPTGIAVVEAIGTLKWAPNELRVLSVGCLEDIIELRKAYGALRFAPKAAHLFMAGQSHGSMGIAHILTGDPHDGRAIHRVSQAVPYGSYRLDSTKQIATLKDRAFAEARHQGPLLHRDFFSQVAEEFTPFKGDQNDGN